MNIQVKQLLICILIPLFVGIGSGILTRNSRAMYLMLNKPKLSPPAIVFPIVWTILYILMGIASYFIVVSNGNNSYALLFYGVQLFFNFMWPILFFNYHLYFISFMWLVILWGLVLITLILFYNINPVAGYLLIPYLLWITFAGYLNLSIFLLN